MMIEFVICTSLRGIQWVYPSGGLEREGGGEGEGEGEGERDGCWFR